MDNTGLGTNVSILWPQAIYSLSRKKERKDKFTQELCSVTKSSRVSEGPEAKGKWAGRRGYGQGYSRDPGPWQSRTEVTKIGSQRMKQWSELGRESGLH